MTELLRPYVPRPVIDWLRATPDQSYRRVRGSFVFADISGFTTLTERLAQHGKVGAEEMGDILNTTFARLLVPAYDFGAALVKWGGDAGLLLFTGDDHAARACRSSTEMQTVMGRIGRVRTTAGQVHLRMSVGVHSGDLDFFLVGSDHRELIITGPGATTVASMEAAASAGEVVVSEHTAAAVDGIEIGEAVGGGRLLLRAPAATPRPQRTPVTAGLDLGSALPAAIRRHISSGSVDSEHRVVTTGFVQFRGVDSMLESQGVHRVAEALEEIVNVTVEAANTYDVTFLASDLSGDGGKLILVAGAPRNHDRAEERMLCALRHVVEQGPALPVRAGTSRGRVFAGDFGPAYRRTYSVVGDSVNLAARLMAHAEPGQLIASPDVVGRSRTRFDVAPLAPFRVKGKAEPVEAVSVGPAQAPSRRQRTDDLPLIGRDPEVRAIDAALRRARTGSGSLVDIVGSAGAGKTRLVDELLPLADREVVLGTVCDGYTAAVPYRPWNQLLRELLSFLMPRRTNTAEAFGTLIRTRCPQLTPWLPLFGAILDVDFPPTPEVDALDDRFRRKRLATALAELLTVVLQTPTVLTLEDAHLADDASLELLEAVAGVAHERPWLIVITRRPAVDDKQTWRHRIPSEIVTVPLGPLSDEDAAHLLERATDGHPIPAHVLERLCQTAAGNPLFLIELLEAQRRTGDTATLPDSLEGILAAAVDSLPTRLRRVLRTASVLGTRFPRSLLDGLLDSAGNRAGNEVLRALDDFLVIQRGEVRFRHTLSRDAAYEALPYRTRVELHAVAAGLLEAATTTPSHDEIASMSFHFYCARQYRRAADYSLTAGDLARARYANVEAASFYRRALDALQAADAGHEERLAVAENLGQVWYAAGDMTEAAAAFCEARRYVQKTDRIARARLGLHLARVRRRAGNPSLALRWLTRSLSELAGGLSVEERTLMGRICACYAQVRHEQGRQREAIAWARRAIEQISRAEAADVIADAYQYLDVSCIALGDYTHAAEATEALAIWEQLGDRTRMAGVLNHLGIRAYFQGDWTQAASYYHRARDELQRIGDQWNAAVVALNIIEIQIDQGRTAEAEALARQTLRVFQAASTPAWVAAIHDFLGRVAVKEARYADAISLFTAARESKAQVGESAHVADIDARLLECLVYQGHAREALLRCEAQIARVTGTELRSVLPRLERVRGWALLALGDRVRAVEAFQLSLEEARALNMRPEVAAALDALVQLAIDAGELPETSLLAERDALFERLGIVSVPFTATADGVISVPEQATEVKQYA